MKLFIAWFFLRKHKYHNGAWPIGTCMYCDHKTGLDTWQLRQMPMSMALCINGERMGFWEKIFGTINCAPY